MNTSNCGQAMNVQRSKKERAVAVALVMLCGAAFAQAPQILVNHIGYDQNSSKRAVVLGHEGDEVGAFKVLDARSGKEILSGSAVNVGAVAKWKDWRFWTLDLARLNTEGAYVIECATGRGAVRSFPFQVRSNLLERETLSGVIAYFKGQRCSGLLDQA